jgi:hypothetical protein
VLHAHCAAVLLVHDQHGLAPGCAQADCRRAAQNDVNNRIGARQLGYYLFWNLRSTTSGLGLSEQDVIATARHAGIKHVESAWQLLDRNADAEATLDEVVNSVEEVFTNRRSLAKTLVDNQTVVGQVEKAIWITLFIFWVFVVVALFDAGSLQRTWTGLSASLLSFSFIFGNSIRQVRGHLLLSSGAYACVACSCTCTTHLSPARS